MTKRVMILATDGFEQSELMKPKANLEKAGIETEVVSLEEGSIRGWDQKDWGESVAVDKTVDAINNCDGYDALLLPGGQMNPDILRMNERAVAIVREFALADKPIAAICHAPWLLAEAGLIIPDEQEDEVAALTNRRFKLAGSETFLKRADFWL